MLRYCIALFIVFSGLNPKGLFTQLDDILVDGFVSLKSMVDDYYVFNPSKNLFRGRNYKHEFHIGDSVKISAIDLPDGVRPSIADRDFTIATVAAPTVMVEEETVDELEDGEEGEGIEGAAGEGEADGETQSPPAGGDADQ